MRILRLDFETFSALDIKKVGAHKYARHPSTEVLMAAYHIDGVPYHWDATRGGMPANLEQALHDPDVIVRAFNAQFERLILWHVLQIRVPIARFQCTMVRAYRHSFKGNMFEVGEQLGLPAHLLKSKAGGSLIHRFCKPAPANHKADRYTRETDPEKWQQFIEYNIQDVVTEAAIDVRLDEYYPTPQFERDLYVLDQIINDRGVPVDTQMIAAAQRIANVTKSRLLAALRDLTGLSNPNSSAQLIPWLLSREAPVPRKWSAAKKQSVHTLDKDAIERMLKFELSDDVRRVLELKRQIGKTSITKYKAFQQAEDQGVVRGMFQINGAQRTGRWAGRVVQLHNLATPRIEDLDTAAEIVRTGNADLLAMFYDDPIQTLSYTIRPVIYSGPDKVWNVSDLGSIESRMLGYHSGCERINRIFAEGKDTYKDFATELYGIPYEEVTKPQRTFAKPPTLGCGYRLGGPGLVAYAAGMGVDMTKAEGFRAVRLYRKAFPEVVNMWYWLENADERAVKYDETVEGYGVRIWKWKDMLCTQLPSGRIMYYHKPEFKWMSITFELESGETKTVEKETLTFMGTGKFQPSIWTRVPAHGGVRTENIIQASARDVLAVWQTRAHQAGFDLRLHVHDEVGALENSDRLEELNNLIRQPIEWAPALHLDAAGYVSHRYRKD